MSEVTRAEICAVACADTWADAGSVLASPVGIIPSVGARLARLTTAPDLLLSDGEGRLLERTPALGEDPEKAGTEGWMPFQQVLDMLAGGRRRVMMGATQLDRHGNQNISRIGSWEQPKVQLIGARGAPGNTVNHTTNYWVQQHSKRVFVDPVDLVCGIGHDRAAHVGAQYHDVQVVITDLAVLDFGGPEGTMRLRSVHPGVTPEEVQERTGFPLVMDAVEHTRLPTDEELELIRTRVDPQRMREQEVAT